MHQYNSNSRAIHKIEDRILQIDNQIREQRIKLKESVTPSKSNMYKTPPKTDSDNNVANTTFTTDPKNDMTGATGGQTVTSTPITQTAPSLNPTNVSFSNITLPTSSLTTSQPHYIPMNPIRHAQPGPRFDSLFSLETPEEKTKKLELEIINMQQNHRKQLREHEIIKKKEMESLRETLESKQNLLNEVRPLRDARSTGAIPKLKIDHKPLIEEKINIDYKLTPHQSYDTIQRNSCETLEGRSNQPNKINLDGLNADQLRDIIEVLRDNQNELINQRPNQCISQAILNDKPRESYLRRLRSIPIFDGDSFKQLRDFIDISESLFYSSNNNSEKNEFFEQTLLQIRGEARNVVKNIDEQNWELIKNTLLSHFDYLANKELITSKLENLRQEKKETLSEFADRTRKLLREKNGVYKLLTEDQKAEHERLARKAFSKGVNNPKLKERLLIRGANTFEEAVAYALDAENESINIVQNAELHCRFCRNIGHRERDCRQKNTDQIDELVQALSSLNKFNRVNFGPMRNNQRSFNRPNQPNFNPNFNNSRNQNNWNSNPSSSNNNNNSMFNAPRNNPYNNNFRNGQNFNRNNNNNNNNSNNNNNTNNNRFGQNNNNTQRNNNNNRMNTITSELFQIQEDQNNESEN